MTELERIIMESCDSGIIDISTRNSMLDVLSLRSYEIDEKVHMDTMLKDFKLFTSGITLYHFTHRNLSKIEPMTINIGNKLARPRKSSWWTPYKSQGGWVLMTAIKAFFPEVKWKDYGWTVRELYVEGGKVRLPIGVIRRSFYEKNKDFIDSYKVYKYTKTFKGTELGLGTEYSVKEYTCDKSVTPDKKEILTFDDIRKYIIIAEDNEMNDYVNDFAILKKNGKHLQDMVNQNKPWLYFDFDDAQKMKARYVERHPNVKKYSANDRKIQ